ncbi:hypothetical protein [Halobacillus salinus]|uniref:Uncharacterized protein n=1 Tax=Halobacillus salinus TaxID=192814 RepID=A0A4Z0H5F4_9BACI|nr:hypothetical protein [Halobacillus salinus]TGB05114.1 hypothetical protein E4663_09005 [Halobacillus salinus]
MRAKQRVHGPYYPSHALVSNPTEQKSQLNHWCEEIDHCSEHQSETPASSDTRSQIMKAAPTSYTN